MSREHRRPRKSRKKDHDDRKDNPHTINRSHTPGEPPDNCQNNRFFPLSENEIRTTVCKLYVQGRSATEIVKRMLDEHGVHLSVKTPNRYFREAALRGRVEYRAPVSLRLRTKLRNQNAWLEGIEVVRTTANRHVAARGARVLEKLVKQLVRGSDKKEEVHIVWSGGMQTRELAKDFIRRLTEQPEGWPARIVIHCVISGVRVEDPTLDPSSMFFEQLDEYYDGPVELQVIGMPGPVLVDSDSVDVEALESMPELKSVRAEAEKLDIVVTAATSWTDEDGLFRQHMALSPQTTEWLESANIEGDILWCPIGRRKPIEVNKGLRFLTLLDLTQLPRFIADGKKVLLALGPCARCHGTRSTILKAVLGQEKPLITHLVVDSRTARQAIFDSEEDEGEDEEREGRQSA